MKLKPKKILLFLIFRYCLIPLQAQIKEIYVNDQLAEISKKEFLNNFKSPDYYSTSYNLDTLIVNVKIKRIVKGQLAKDTLDFLKNKISESSQKTIPTNNKIVVIYHHGLDICLKTGKASFIKSQYKNFLKQINTQKEVSLFFIYKNNEGTEIYGNNINWIKDPSGIIENLFLPLHYPCGSYILIDNIGNYFIQKGEYSTQTILKLLREEKNTFNPNKKFKF